MQLLRQPLLEDISLLQTTWIHALTWDGDILFFNMI